MPAKRRRVDGHAEPRGGEEGEEEAGGHVMATADDTGASDARHSASQRAAAEALATRKMAVAKRPVGPTSDAGQYHFAAPASTLKPDASPQSSRRDTTRGAMEALNAAFAAFVNEQLESDPRADLSMAAKEYAAHAHEICAKFELADLDEWNDPAEAGPSTSPSSPMPVFRVSSESYKDDDNNDEAEQSDALYFGASLDIDQLSGPGRGAFVSEPSRPPPEFVGDGHGDHAGGFLASHATYGAASIWSDAELLAVRIPSEQLQCHDLIAANDHSEVFRGVFVTHVNTVVAVKRLAGGGQNIADALRVAEGMRWTARLRHRNIVAFVGVAWDKAFDIQAATEFMARGDLRSLLDSPDAVSLPWGGFKCQVAIQIVEALQYIHSVAQETHTTKLTSRKVLLDASGTAKLNLLHFSCEASALSHVRYTAPEVLTGGPPSWRSDMYALGMLLAVLDTTKEPFDAVVNPNGAKAEDALIAQRVASGTLRSTLSPECPETIASLVGHCTALDAAARPDALRVAYALREVLKNDL